jgi:hypothetical protein
MTLHDGVPDCLFRQEANFTESTNLPQAHKTALNKRSYAGELRSYDEHSLARPAPALTLDSAKSVAFIERHGECDLPTRRHAEESRPTPMQGRTMSPILAHSAEELMKPCFVSRAAMARPEIPVLTPTFLLISGCPKRGQQILP